MPTADYQRIADDLRRRLAEGEWSPGEQLPPRAQLAHEYQTSPAAVQRGQELLIDTGLLEGRKSVGVFVRAPQARIALPVLLSIPDAIRQAGLVPGIEYRSDVKVPAPEPIARRLSVDIDTLCVRTRYEYLGNARPLALGESWEPMALTHRTPVLLPEDGPLAGTGVARRMASVGVRVGHAQLRTHARHPDDHEALRLGITRRTLIVRLDRTHLTDTGRPVETATFLLPQTRWELVYDVPVPACDPLGDGHRPQGTDAHAPEGRPARQSGTPRRP
ncbi:GntR family transcriptional regulator [Streptomyces sp. MBT62]|uniref:GntR family transcriptional regulator n=1 Tax=Streptomyces sp. MBT62 TaxID=2800410 RepID=UPI00190C659C|nr:GntR family transcriptional regulator [Streptomyces sp. MBT62]MBK3564829.1 GntR family transcriptional regulator [Streptomyces sp. MBT62]